jgi:hypothetical protein
MVTSYRYMVRNNSDRKASCTNCTTTYTWISETTCKSSILARQIKIVNVARTLRSSKVESRIRVDSLGGLLPHLDS